MTFSAPFLLQENANILDKSAGVLNSALKDSLMQKTVQSGWAAPFSFSQAIFSGSSRISSISFKISRSVGISMVHL